MRSQQRRRYVRQCPVALTAVLVALHQLEHRPHLLGRLEAAGCGVRVGLGRVGAAAEDLAHHRERRRLGIERVEAGVVDDRSDRVGVPDSEDRSR